MVPLLVLNFLLIRKSFPVNTKNQKTNTTEKNETIKDKAVKLTHKLLKLKINSETVISARRNDLYYQLITNIGKPLRHFHNWIKSIIIYSYCSPGKENRDGKVKKKNVLDLGCGRGGDIMKMYHSRVGEFVGIDPDYEGLFGVLDSATVR